MSTEQLKVVISENYSGKIADLMRFGLENGGVFQVVKITSVEVSQIRSLIEPVKPDVLLICTDIPNRTRINELKGFVGKVRKHVPETKIVLVSPRLDWQEIIHIGVDNWIEQTLNFKSMAKRLSQIVSSD